MSLRSVDMHLQSEFLSHRLDHLQPSLIIWTSTSNPNRDSLTTLENGGILPQSLTHTLERLRDVREIGNPTTDEQDLLTLSSRSRKQIQHSLRILIRLPFSRRSRILSIVQIGR